MNLSNPPLARDSVRHPTWTRSCVLHLGVTRRIGTRTLTSHRSGMCNGARDTRMLCNSDWILRRLQHWRKRGGAIPRYFVFPSCRDTQPAANPHSLVDNSETGFWPSSGIPPIVTIAVRVRDRSRCSLRGLEAVLTRQIQEGSTASPQDST